MTLTSKLAHAVDHGGSDDLAAAIRQLTATGPEPDPLFLEVLRRRLLEVVAQEAGVRRASPETPEPQRPRRKRRRTQ